MTLKNWGPQNQVNEKKKGWLKLYKQRHAQKIIIFFSQYFTNFPVWFEKLLDKDGRRLLAAHAYFCRPESHFYHRAPKHNSTWEQVIPSLWGSGNQCMNPQLSPHILFPWIYTCNWTHVPRARSMLVQGIAILSQLISKFLLTWWQCSSWKKKTSQKERMEKNDIPLILEIKSRQSSHEAGGENAAVHTAAPFPYQFWKIKKG